MNARYSYRLHLQVHLLAAGLKAQLQKALHRNVSVNKKKLDYIYIYHVLNSLDLAYEGLLRVI